MAFLSAIPAAAQPYFWPILGVVVIFMGFAALVSFNNPALGCQRTPVVDHRRRRLGLRWWCPDYQLPALGRSVLMGDLPYYQWLITLIAGLSFIGAAVIALALVTGCALGYLLFREASRHGI